MAKTLIGQLVLRLRAEGLNEANRVQQAMSEVEASARRLASTGAPSWGVAFQRQLNQLKLTKDELDEVQRSWVSLHDAIRTKKLTPDLRSNEISHWKTATVTQLATVRSEVDNHLREVERRAKEHAKRLDGIMRPAFVAMGGYTGAYLSGIMGMEALSASSERRREVFRYQMMGVPAAEQEQLFSSSEALGQKYPSVPITGVMEIHRSAYATMGSAERAIATAEAMLESLVVAQATNGPEAAARQLSLMIRGLDVLGVNEDSQIGIDQVRALIDAATKASQVDEHFDPADYFAFARRAKVAGPAFSMDFLARAPTYMQDLGADATGNALAMAFKGFVLEAVGSAGGKRYLQERERLGLRDENGLVEAGLFGSDPDVWVQKHLVPALKRDGVNLDDGTAVAAAVGKLTGNTNASAILTRMITQREQTERWLRIMEQSMGLDAAPNVRFEDPFVGWKAFKSSLANLSSALTPIDTINAKLNALADGINALAKAGEDNPLAVALGIGGAGYGAYKGGQYLLGKASDAFGLKSSALALDGSAAALTRAAIALGGAGVLDGKAPGKDPSVFGTPLMVALGSLLSLKGSTPENEYANAPEEERARMREEARRRAGELNLTRPQGFFDWFMGDFADPEFSLKDAMRIDAGIARKPAEDTKAAGAELEDALDIRATPQVDTSEMDAALARTIGLARRLRNELSEIGSAVSSATSNVGAELRRNYAD